AGIFEVVEKVDQRGRQDAVVNLRGDLPTIDPAAIRAVLAPLDDAAVDIATIVTRIVSDEERDNPNMVKAAVAMGPTRPGRPATGRALYFSRLPVPSGDGPHYHHIGIYAYRRARGRPDVAATRPAPAPPGGGPQPRAPARRPR